MATNLSLFTVGGTVQANKKLYLNRQADQQLLELCRAGTFTYVLAPRQLGKSSLMMRTARRLTEQGIRTVIIDLTQLGTQLTAEAWYLGLLAIIEDQLLLESNVVAWWKTHADLGITQRLTRFFEEVLLKEVTAPIVIFVDEIDTTLSLSFTDDFFASIRYFYQVRVRLEEFQRLSFVLIGVATPGDLIQDPTRTPFNIGQRLDMTDFTLEEALPLADGLNLSPEAAQQVLGWVLGWTGGHPYLTQRLCQVLAAQKGKTEWSESEIIELVENTFLRGKSEQDNNLQFVRDMLTKRATNPEELLRTYRAIRAGKRAVVDQEQSVTKSHLKLSGVVKRQGQVLQVRNNIYRTVFDEKWIKEHLPVNWARRLRQALGLIAASLLLVILMGGLTVYAFIQQSEAQKQQQVTLSQALGATAINQIQSDPERSILLAVEAVKIARTTGNDAAIAQASDALRQTLGLARFELSSFAGHGSQILQGAFSPDGLYVVTASDDQTARVWGARDGKELVVLKPLGGLGAALFSPDGKYVLTSGQTDTARLWEFPDGKELASMVHSDEVVSAVFSPDGRYILTASRDQTARVWEVPTGKEVLTLKGHTGPLTGAAFSPDGKYIVTSAWDKTARVWDSRTGQVLTTLSGHTSFEVTSAAFSPDGKYIVTAGGDNTARLWETANGKEIATLGGQTGAVVSAVFSPDGRYILTASGYTAKVWSVPDGVELAILGGHTDFLRGASFSPDGRYIATFSGKDRLVKIWETGTWKEYDKLYGPVHTVSTTSLLESYAVFSPDSCCLLATNSYIAVVREIQSMNGRATFKGHTGEVSGASYSPDGRSLATVSYDGSVKVWDIATGKEKITLFQSAAGAKAVEYSPDGRYIATLNNFNLIKLWDAVNGKELFSLYDSGFGGLDYSPDGRLLKFSHSSRYVLGIVAPYTSRVRLWDTSSGQPVMEFDSHEPFSSLDFSPDDRYILAASPTGSPSIWEIQTQKKVLELKGQAGVALDAVYSPDGRTIATGGEDGIAIIWDAHTGQPEFTLHGHTGKIRSVAFSPDGRYLATAGDDNTVRIWETQSGKLLTILTGQTGLIYSVAFSPDGQRVVTASQDGTAQIYVVTTDELLRIAQSRVTRELTAEERIQYGLNK
jgi:WD40 repeat protein